MTSKPSKQNSMLKISQTLVSFLGLMAFCAARPVVGADNDRLECTPYTAQIDVFFAASRDLAPSVSAQILAELQTRLDENVGAAWSADVSSRNLPTLANRSGLQRLSPAAVMSMEDAVDEDMFAKRFLVGIAPANAGWEVCVREWDALSQTLGPLATASVRDPTACPSVVYDLLGDVFRPIVELGDVDLGTRSVAFTLKAGAFAPVNLFNDADADPLHAQVHADDVILPFIQYRNRDGSLRKNQFLPWTYLVVDNVERGRGMSHFVSGIRVPLGSAQSKRVRTFGLAVKPLFPKSELQLRLRRNPDRRLAAHDVTIATSARLADEPETKLGDLFTDRNGVVEIPVYQASQIVWIYIKSGQQLLAKLPYAPGLEEFATVDLPDDGVRLEVEGDIDQLKSRLVDVVARRAAATIRARALAKANNWKGVDRELKTLKELPTRADLQSDLTQIRLPRLERARKQKNNVAVRKIQSQCDEISLLIDRYLDPQKIREFEEEIGGLRP